MNCLGCDGPLPPAKSTGRPRKWCSENCRKRAWDRQNRPNCVDCGAVIWRGKRCVGCEYVARHAHHEATLDAVERMWNEGMEGHDISLALGRSGTGFGVNAEIDELRKAGRVGYRYNMRDGKRVAG